MPKKKIPKKKSFFKRGRTKSTTELVDKITRQSSDEGDFARSPTRSKRKKKPASTESVSPEVMAKVVGGLDEEGKPPGTKPKKKVPEWKPIKGSEWKRKAPKDKKPTPEELGKVPAIKTKSKKAQKLIAKIQQRAKRIRKIVA